MKASLLIPRLRAQCPAFSNRIAAAADLASVTLAEELAVPCAFVVPTGLEASENQLVGAVLQDCQDTFSVVVCLSNTADERGQQAQEDEDTIRSQIMAALIGYAPDSLVNFGRIEFRAEGEELEVDRARIWHRYDFAVSTFIAG